MTLFWIYNTGGSMIVAYLINQYPQPSQSFIRREIAGLEGRGVRVERYTLRRWKGVLVDKGDQEEAEKTRVILDVGVWGLMGAMLGMMAKNFPGFWRGVGLAMKMGWGSDRGMLVHGIYLAEACMLAKWLREAGAEHVHAHFGTNSTTVAMLCSVMGGAGFSFTAHGPEEFDRPGALGLEEKIRRARFVVAISEFGRSQLYRWAKVADWGKIHVVRCGVDELFLKGNTPLPPAEGRLVCVGRLASDKGQMLLVRAAAKLRREGVDVWVRLVGDGPMREEIEREIERLGIRERVKILGWRSNEEVREEIVKARALVMASFAEGLPVVIMEAMGLGRPVIVPRLAGIPELVEGGVCGWVVSAGSEEALVEAMRVAVEMPVEMILRMGEEGRMRVAKQHDAGEEAGKLGGLFAKYAKKRRGQGSEVRGQEKSSCVG